MLDFQKERLRKLPQRQGETWQGGWVRCPTWAKGQDGKPIRPWTPLWTSLKTGLVGGSPLGEEQEKTNEASLAALVDFASDQEIAGYTPGKLEVNDPALAEYLKSMLADLNISVAYRQTLFGLKHFIDEMTKKFAPDSIGQGLIDVPGMTLGRIRAFAEAAKLFYEAAPWRYVSNDDLVSIDQPRPDELSRFVVVLGAAGFQRGLGFVPSIEDFWKIQGCDDDRDEFIDHMSTPVCNALYGDISHMLIPDADLWEGEKLPVAGPSAYMFSACYGPGPRLRRPGPRKLTFQEGLLRALAATTEDELDSGRWTKEVVSFEGTTVFELSLPLLLNPPTRQQLARVRMIGDTRGMERAMAEVERRLERSKPQTRKEVEKIMEETVPAGKSIDEIEYSPETAAEKAQDICYQAFDAFGRRRIKMARQALALDPLCADAYVIIAETKPDDEEARALYERGVAAGEQSLGPEMFKENAGHFWGIHRTRPYMRALFGLAQTLYGLGRREEAVDYMRKLLELNPNDNQGVRDLLLPALMEIGRDDDALKLRGKYNESTAISLYCAVLLAFRKSGDAGAAAKALKKALEANPYVPPYLLKPPAGEELPEFYKPGGEKEAILCAVHSIKAWRSTPGALEWLKKMTGSH